MFRIIFAVFVFSQFILAQDGTISGTVTNSAEQKPMQGCNVFISEISNGTITDRNGKFEIKIPYGTYSVKVSFVGFHPFEEKITLSSERKRVNLTVGLLPSPIETGNVNVTASKEQPATISVEVKERDLKRIPNVYHDVLRSVQILPGVTTNSELSSGYNVRGGNFDNNLIYLNGFEIYRPFLLRQGMEENQTLISPELTNQLRFFNGNFPASYGDKMSSALDVNYVLDGLDSLTGSVRFDVTNAGASVKDKIGNVRLAAASRYSYPGLFLDRLQTKGVYSPSFYDFQFISDYTINENENLKVFILYAHNKYDLSPASVTGHLSASFDGSSYSGVEMIYKGDRTYLFSTGLAGVKYSNRLSNKIQLKTAAAFYNTSEKENSSLSWGAYYFEVMNNKRVTTQYIKSGIEDAANSLNLSSIQIMPSVECLLSGHTLNAGFDIRLTGINNSLNELFSETSDSALVYSPLSRQINQSYNPNTYSAFIQDEFSILDNIFVNAGIRTTYCSYNDETLISPRVNILYNMSPKHSFTVSWGYYSQPPYYAELRNKPDVNKNKLLAQKSLQYSAGWEYKFKEKVKFNLEAYYSFLNDLIPYYIEREKIEYLDANNSKGYAFGFDATFQGEITRGLNSWVSYAYLDTKEKKKNSNEAYKRRLTDQNHTVQVFLQDKIKKHPNWQSHARFVWGSGYLYNLFETKTDPATNRKYIQISPDRKAEFLMYFRMDMGLSAAYNFGGKKVTFVAEVLNVFNHLNYAGYNFVNISTGNEMDTIYYLPKVLSRRFFNFGVEITI